MFGMVVDLAVFTGGRGKPVYIQCVGIRPAAVYGEVRVILSVHRNVPELAIAAGQADHAGRQLSQPEWTAPVDRNAHNFRIVHYLAERGSVLIEQRSRPTTCTESETEPNSRVISRRAN